MILQVEEVSKVFRHGDDELTLFNGLSFQLAAGDSLALTGPSGSGKTTLLRMIAALETPTAGKIIMQGRRVDQLLDDAARRFRLRNIGFVYQEHRLLPQLTALENVALPGVAVGQDCAEQAQKLLAAVGLAKKSCHFPSQLSGGECQRVAVARALVLKPTLLLADEPTGQLDAARATRLLELLQQLNLQEKVTLIMATHSEKAKTYLNRHLSLE